MNTLKTFDSGYFIGKNYFENDGTQNYLVFQPMNKYLKFDSKTGLLSEWEAKGLSNKIIKALDNSVAPRPRFENDGKRYFVFRSCLKEDRAKREYDKIINIYIAYDLQSNLSHNPDFTLENCLFGAFKITKNTDVDKYKYSGYGIGFDGRGVFTHPAGIFGNSAIIFGVDISSSVHIDNKGKDILILGSGLTQGLGLYYNGENSYLFVNGTEMIKFKVKDSEIDANILCLGNVSKDFAVDEMKKTRIVWNCLWV